ncbi:MAG: ETX/MTX2 family pore-forming toxin [Candidatus Electronema sp. VV]
MATQTQYVTALYPSVSGAGGVPTDYVGGNYIKTISIYSGAAVGGGYADWSFIALKAEFDSGTTMTMGCSGGTGLPANAIPIGYIDLSSDSISYIYIKSKSNGNFKAGVGVGDICFVTMRGNVLASTNENPANGNTAGWSLVKPLEQNVPSKNMVLNGLIGNAGDAVDQIGFYYNEDTMLSKSSQDFSYDDPATGLSTLKYTFTDVLNVSSQTVTNLTSAAQTASVNFSESVSTATSWTLGAGLTAGGEVDVTVKIPFVNEDTVKLSAEVSLSVNWGKTTTTTDQFSYQADVTVNPGKSVTATATAASAIITGTFTATLLENWQHAGAISQQISGTINSVGADGVVVKYTEADAPSGQ